VGRRIAGPRFERFDDHTLDVPIAGRPGASCTTLVQQAFKTFLGEPVAPVTVGADTPSISAICWCSKRRLALTGGQSVAFWRS